jgi:hypothetical protein
VEHKTREDEQTGKKEMNRVKRRRCKLERNLLEESAIFPLLFKGRPIIQGERVDSLESKLPSKVKVPEGVTSKVEEAEV